MQKISEKELSKFIYGSIFCDYSEPDLLERYLNKEVIPTLPEKPLASKKAISKVTEGLIGKDKQ